MSGEIKLEPESLINSYAIQIAGVEFDSTINNKINSSEFELACCEFDRFSAQQLRLIACEIDKLNGVKNGE